MGKAFKITVKFQVYIFLYIVLLLFNVTKAKAQHNFFYKEDVYAFSTDTYYNYPTNNLRNDYQSFPNLKDLFTDTLNKHNVKFKKVVENDYISKDTSLKSKKLVKKIATVFNNEGFGIYRVEADSNGIDTIRYFYDAQFRGIKWEYNSTIQAGDNYVLVRDKNGLILKDSNAVLGYMGNKNLTGYFVANFKYDSSGNCIRYFYVYHNTVPFSESDTIIVLKQYDNRNRIIAVHHYNMGTWGIGYYKYDNHSNIIDATSIDSLRGITMLHLTKVFDAKNRVIFEKKFDYYRGTHKTSVTYNADGGKTDTTEFIGRKDPTDPNSCTITSKTVTVYNKFGDLISETVTSLTGGKTSTSTSTHKSQYNTDGKLLCDSEITITESQMSYGRALFVMTYKYDIKGNKIESNYSGMDEKWLYKYNEKNKLVEEDRYDGLCSDKPNLRHLITYYPDGVTVKEDISDNLYGGKVIKKYGKDTEQTEFTGTDPGNVNQIITEYFQ